MADDTAADTATPAISREQQWEMLQSVENMIKGQMRFFRVPGRMIEDLSQDVKVSLLDAMRNFQPGRVKWSTYAHPVISRTIADALRRDTSHRSTVVEDAFPENLADDDAPDEEVIPDVFNDLANAVREQLASKLLEKLAPKSRELVRLVAVERLSPEQIAERLGYPAKAVKIQLRNAIARMGLQRPPLSNPSHAYLRTSTFSGRVVEIDGRSQTIREWAKERDIPLASIARRLQVGWPDVRALSEPVLRSRKRLATPAPVATPPAAIVAAVTDSTPELGNAVSEDTSTAQHVETPTIHEKNTSTRRQRVQKSISLKTMVTSSDGTTKTIGEWARDLGMSYSTIRERLRLGWTVQMALSKPIRPKGRPKGPIKNPKTMITSADGRTQTIRQWSRELGIHESTLSTRLRSGWSHQDALSKSRRYSRSESASSAAL